MKSRRFSGYKSQLATVRETDYVGISHADSKSNGTAGGLRSSSLSRYESKSSLSGGMYDSSSLKSYGSSRNVDTYGSGSLSRYGSASLYDSGKSSSSYDSHRTPRYSSSSLERNYNSLPRDTGSSARNSTRFSSVSDLRGSASNISSSARYSSTSTDYSAPTAYKSDFSSARRSYSYSSGLSSANSTPTYSSYSSSTRTPSSSYLSGSGTVYSASSNYTPSSSYSSSYTSKPSSYASPTSYQSSSTPTTLSRQNSSSSTYRRSTDDYTTRSGSKDLNSPTTPVKLYGDLRDAYKNITTKNTYTPKRLVDEKPLEVNPYSKVLKGERPGSTDSEPQTPAPELSIEEQFQKLYERYVVNSTVDTTSPTKESVEEAVVDDRKNKEDVEEEQNLLPKELDLLTKSTNDSDYCSGGEGGLSKEQSPIETPVNSGHNSDSESIVEAKRPQQPEIAEILQGEGDFHRDTSGCKKPLSLRLFDSTAKRQLSPEKKFLSEDHNVAVELSFTNPYGANRCGCPTTLPVLTRLNLTFPTIFFPETIVIANCQLEKPSPLESVVSTKPIGDLIVESATVTLLPTDTDDMGGSLGKKKNSADLKKPIELVEDDEMDAKTRWQKFCQANIQVVEPTATDPDDSTEELTVESVSDVEEDSVELDLSESIALPTPNVMEISTTSTISALEEDSFNAAEPLSVRVESRVSSRVRSASLSEPKTPNLSEIASGCAWQQFCYDLDDASEAEEELEKDNIATATATLGQPFYNITVTTVSQSDEEEESDSGDDSEDEEIQSAMQNIQILTSPIEEHLAMDSAFKSLETKPPIDIMKELMGLAEDEEEVESISDFEDYDSAEEDLYRPDSRSLYRDARSALSNQDLTAIPSIMVTSTEFSDAQQRDGDYSDVESVLGDVSSEAELSEEVGEEEEVEEMIKSSGSDEYSKAAETQLEQPTLANDVMTESAAEFYFNEGFRDHQKSLTPSDFEDVCVDEEIVGCADEQERTVETVSDVEEVEEIPDVIVEGNDIPLLFDRVLDEEEVEEDVEEAEVEDILAEEKVVEVEEIEDDLNDSTQLSREVTYTHQLKLNQVEQAEEGEVDDLFEEPHNAEKIVSGKVASNDYDFVVSVPLLVASVPNEESESFAEETVNFTLDEFQPQDHLALIRQAAEFAMVEPVKPLTYVRNETVNLATETAERLKVAKEQLAKATLLTEAQKATGKVQPERPQLTFVMADDTNCYSNELEELVDVSPTEFAAIDLKLHGVGETVHNRVQPTYVRPAFEEQTVEKAERLVLRKDYSTASATAGLIRGVSAKAKADKMVLTRAPSIEEVIKAESAQEIPSLRVSPETITKLHGMSERYQICVRPTLVKPIEGDTPTDKADRLVNRIESLKQDVKPKLVRGVAEKVRIGKQPVRVAVGKLDVPAHSALDMPNELLEPKYRGHGVYEVWTPAIRRTHVKPVGVEIIYDRMDYFSPKKPAEDFGKKSVHQGFKLDCCKVSQPQVLVGFNDLPDKLKKKFLPDAGGATVAQKTEEKMPEKLAKQPEANKNAKTSAQPQAKPEQKQLGDERKAKQTSVSPQPDSFELQMEELRSKLKLGSSTLTKQMKELSRGIATITAEAKLKTLETSETKAAITEAAQQRNEVTEKYSQWKSTAEEEFKKRETQISQIAEKTEKRGREMLELEKKAQPKPTAQLGLKSRPPGRVTSAFIEKEVEAERKPTVPAIKLAEPTKVVEPMKQSINNRKVEKSALSDVTNRTEPDGNAEGKNLTSLVEQTAVSHQTQRQEAELKGSKIVHADLLQHGVAEAKTKEANRLTSELSKSRLHSADEVAKVGSKEPQQKYQARVDSAKIKSTAELIEVEKPGETAKVGVKDAPHKYQSRLDSSKKLTSSAELIETAQVGVKDGQKYQSRLEPTKLVGISSTLEPSKVPRKSSRSRSSRRGAKRQNRFIGAIEDIDDLLKIKRLKTFEQFETLYDAEIRQKRPEGKVKRTRPEPLQLRTFIGDCEDFDEILGPKDLRAVMSQFSPTSRVTFDFFVNESTTKPPATGLKHKFGGKTTDLATKYRKLGDGAEAKQAKLVSMSKLVVNVQYLNDINPFTGDGRLEPIRPISYTFTVYIPLCEQIQPLLRLLRAPHKAESASLQIYQKNGDEFQTILDLDASLQDQPDELEMLKDSRKSLVLRTKISVRVHLIIEKLLNSTGRDLRRALFSLKQIFQDDKDLVHEFVQNDGLACLIKVGAEADQNYQNYILRALGQVMLYVDGMNGVIAHNETIQWLYSLLSSKFRLVVKTALKLLVVFVEYTESNSLLLLAAVYIVDKERDILPWANIMNVMSEKDTSDLELFLYAMTLVNKALHGIPDQDTYYDVVDSLEAQEIEAELQRLMSLGSKELTDQCLLYEETLKAEDGDDEALVSAKRSRAAPRHRSNIVNRKSRRTSEDQNTRLTPERTTKPSQHEHHQPNGSATYREKARYGEPKVVKKPDEDNSMDYTFVKAVSRDGTTKPDDISTNATVEMNKFRPAFKKQPSQEASVPGLSQNKRLTMNLLYRRGSVQADEDENGNEDELTVSQTISLPNAKPDASVEDQQVPKPPGFVTPSTGQVNSMADRFQKPLAPPQPTPVPKAEVPHQQEDSDEPPSNNFAAALSKARNSMASKIEKSGTAGAPKKKETDVEWAQAVENLNRPLVINDLDFTELDDSDDHDPFRFPSTSAMQNGPQMPPGGGMPPPPPFGQMGPPPPPGFGPPPPPMGGIPPPPLNRLGPPPPSMNGSTSPERSNSPNTTQKDVKTLRLFWKEVKAAPPTPVTDKRGGTFWDRAVVPVDVDTVKLCQSFETKAKEITQKPESKKEDKRHETIVLDTKRSNAICIGLTKLPPPRAIKAAIVKFDTSIMNKDGIEKILSTMMPTEEEKTKILDAQMANADLPLGKAEQFLLTLASIPELEARLKLWLFMMDYANQERAVAEPLMDLKLAMKQLETCPTFQYVMSTLLAVGNILNGGEVRGFQLDYLAKVPEIKDTVNKYSLVYHLCQIVMEKFPDSTDLYSELGAVSRCARVDFDEVSSDLEKMEKDCKESWDHLRSLAKYEAFAMNQKISEFLTDCAQRILTLNVIHRRVFNRFHNFLLFMGLPLHVAKDTKVNSICKIISEFSLEYRTTRERAVQMKKRSETKRERNKTRGKTIVDVNANLRGVAADSHTHLTAEEKKRHGELQSVLNQSNSADPSRLKSRPAQPKSFPRGSQNETQPSGDSPEEDDPIFKGLIDMASHADQPRIVQRRRAKQFNRKSLRRTRTLKLDDTEAADQPES